MGGAEFAVVTVPRLDLMPRQAEVTRVDGSSMIVIPNNLANLQILIREMTCLIVQTTHAHLNLPEALYDRVGAGVETVKRYV